MKYWLKVFIPTILILLILSYGMTLIQQQYIRDYLLKDTEERVIEEISLDATVLADALSRYFSSQDISPYASETVLQKHMERYVAYQPYQENGVYLRLYKIRRRYRISSRITEGSDDYYQYYFDYLQCFKADRIQKNPIELSLLEDGEVKIVENLSDGTLACVMRSLPNYGDVRLVYYQTINKRSWNQVLTIVQIFGLVAAVLMGLIMFMIIRVLTEPLNALAIATREYTRGSQSQNLDPVGWNEVADLASLYNTLADENRRLEAVEEDAKRKQQFLSSFTHEMRTPMTNIYGYSELMMRLRLSEEDRLRYLDYIMHESSRLNRLSQELFKLIVLRESGTQMEIVPCAELLDAAFQTISPKAKKKGVSLICNSCDESIYGNRALLESLCINLCENAVRACSEDDVVQIGFESEKKFIILRVADTGIGIAQDQIEHITEPFFRVDKARSRSEGGVGLGLYLCSEIVRIHGTRLFFDSKEGEGTTVTVRFPVPKIN